MGMHTICIVTALHSKAGDDFTGSFAAQLPTTRERCLTYTYNKKKIHITNEHVSRGIVTKMLC